MNQRKDFKAIIFDLDGTIINALPDLTDALNHVLPQFGYPTRTKEEVTTFIGYGARYLCEKALPEDKSRLDEFFAAYKEYYEAHSLVKTYAYEGIAELINDLQAAGIKVGIFSNKPDIPTKDTVAHFIGENVKAVGDCPGVKRKPDPEGILAMLDEFGIDKKDAYYIGDSEVDIVTSKNADMDCISVSWGFRTVQQLQEAGATIIINSVDELRSFLLG